MATIIGIIILLLALSGIRIANEYQRGVVFRLGRYQGTRGPGLYWLIPLFEWKRTIDLRTQTQAVERQETITQDNVPIKVNAVIWYRIEDPERSVMEVVDLDASVIQVSQTTLRNIIGQHSMDDVLKEQERLAVLMKTKIDGVTEPWGVKVERVEMKSVEIPESMQRVMAQEAEAQREKRARIIKAEAEKEAARQLVEAAEMISKTPYALELRRMQMITEVGAEQNTTTVIVLPSEFVSMARGIGAMALNLHPQPAPHAQPSATPPEKPR
jgi:regulator of protease activity HflC (stomatin/prohibitin superfamily)